MKKRALLFLLVSCLTLSSAPAAIFFLSGPMDVFQATTNPDNVGNGTGTISGDYDDATMLLNYSLTWQNLTTPINNAHFHLGAPGVPGGIELGIPGPWVSPYPANDVPLNSTQETNLLAGNWYVNIHTEMFPGGEIRGQVNVIPEPSAALLALAGGTLGALVLRRRRL